MQNMNDIIKESMIANAIKCNYDESFETILNKLKKTELKAIVDAHGLKGCSSLAKGGLIDRIKTTLADTARLEYILCGLDEVMMSDFVMLVNEPFVSVNDVMSSCVQVLFSLGYVLPVMNGKEVVYVMPQIVKDAYAAIDQASLEDRKSVV